MRSDKEILDRIIVVDPRDHYGAEVGDLVEALSWKTAMEKGFLKKTCTEEYWEFECRLRNDVEVLNEMLRYMDFAWGKANNCRGLSAERSLHHYSAWLWFLGYDNASEQVRHYDFYGKDRLRAICEYLNWDWKKWDDDIWVNDDFSDGIPAPEKVEPLVI